MADYYTQLVVQQNIPSALMSPFEKFLLGEILEHEEIGDGIFYFASEQVRDFLTVLRSHLKQALAATSQRSRLRAFAEKALAASNPDASNPDYDYFDLDLSACEFGSDAHLIILQDIVRRSKGALPHLTIAQPTPAARCGPTASAACASSSRPAASATGPPTKFSNVLPGVLKSARRPNALLLPRRQSESSLRKERSST